MAGLDDAAVAQDGDTVRVVLDQAEVVADEQQAAAGPAHRVQDAVGEFRVQGAGRLVGEDELGVVDRGRADAGPLEHAAGPLVRAVPEPGCRGAYAERAYPLVDDARRHGGAVSAPGLLDVVTNRADRVAGSVRVLGDVPEMAAEQGAPALG